MSGTTTPSPAGLDTMSAAETAELNSMRDDGPEDTAPEVIVETAPEDIDLDAETPEAAEPASDGKTRMVPHGQFHAANERRKAAEAKAAAAETRLATSNAVIEERMRLLTEVAQASIAQSEAKPAPIEIPDVETDPVGHFQALYQATQQQLSDQAAILNGWQEQQRQQQEVAALKAWAVPQEHAFLQKSPDFYDAMTFLREGRHKELLAIGINSQVERDRIIMGDITQIAAKSRNDGVNYAEQLYNVASARGYQKTPAKAAAPVIPAIDADVPAMDRAERAERGRANATTIAASGSAPPVALSVERIANMSDAQFAAHLKKIEGNPAALRDLMGH